MRHRSDNNQGEIVRALRKIGVTVHIASQLGDGFPDLVCGWRGKNYLIEVKSKGGKLRAGQRDFLARWRGEVFVVHSVEQALAVFGVRIET